MEATTSSMVSAAYDAANTSSAEALWAWAGLQGALVENTEVELHRVEFEVAQAANAYAWAVYHAARLDWGATVGMSTVTESYATTDANP